MSILSLDLVWEELQPKKGVIKANQKAKDEAIKADPSK